MFYLILLSLGFDTHLQLQLLQVGLPIFQNSSYDKKYLLGSSIKYLADKTKMFLVIIVTIVVVRCF